MKFHIILKRITKFSFLFGMACLLVSITLLSVPHPGEAATVAGKGNCDTGWVEKVEQAPFVYDGPETIIKVIVKSGLGCFPLTIGSPNDGCYQASGLGTTHVRVTRVGTPDAQICQEISHVEFYAGQVEPTPTEPTPTEPTPTEPTPTEPTPTDPTPTEPTPTEPTPTDPTPTDPTPTEPTPTEPTPTEPTPTEPTPTDPTPTDPTPTDPTPTDSPETVTPTDPPETVTPTDPPPETVTPTEPVRTPTPPPTLSQPTPQKTDSPLILIPVTGVDLSSSKRIYDKITWMVLFTGVGFLGISMILNGFSTKKSRKAKK